jgi:hypothetical protein
MAAPSLPAAEQKASQSQAVKEIDPDVLALRESAWRAWFAGDEPALRSMLPVEFFGISAGGGGDITDLEKTLTAARAFREGGGKLIALSFPETRAQRFGETIVLYGSYEAVIASGGTENKLRVRLTEVFVKRDGRWVHPGWHLDAR